MIMLNAITARKFAVLWALLWGAAALLLQTHMLINPDNASMLFTAERVYNGEQLYVDIYETNPPLIVWIYRMPVLLAHAFGIASTVVFPFFVVAVAALGLWLAYAELKSSPLVFAALAQTLLGCSYLMFGQREHFFLLLALPYFAQVPRESRLSVRQLAIGVMAGIGFAIKPYFLLIWLAGEIYGRHLFRRTNWIIGVVGALYALSVYAFTPHYIDTLLPVLLHTYSAFTGEGGGVFQPLFLLVLMYLLPALLIPWQRSSGVVLCWFFAAVATVALQHKGWLNHYFPVMFFGTWLLADRLAGAIHPWKAGLKHFAAVWALGFIAFALPAYQLIDTARTPDFQNSYIRKLAGIVAGAQAEGKPLYVMSFALDAAFPAVNSLPVTYPFHFHHFWSLPAVVWAEKSGELPAPLAQAKAFTLQAIAEDFERVSPALVVVDTNQFQVGLFKDFDFIAYFKQNAVFRAEWGHYQKVADVTVDGKDAGRADGHYTVYSRMTGD